MLYHSRTIYGDDAAESGYVIAPGGRPPRGGFRILSWAHATTGFAPQCAPSLFSRHYGGVYLLPDLAHFLDDGFVVAAADYPGLGTPGLHPFLVGKSEGQSILDAARAARQLRGLDTTRQVVIYGHSEGGLGALFAGELAPRYAPGLRILGVVAAAPATGLSTIVGASMGSLGHEILPFTLPIAYTWSKTYRDLPERELLTPEGARLAPSLLTTGCADTEASAITRRGLTPKELLRAAFATGEAMRAHALLNDPGRTRTRAPMLVIQGTTDQTIPQALTDQFVSTMACPIGDRIEYDLFPGASHSQIVFRGIHTIVAWINARLAGHAASTTCGRPDNAQVDP